MYEQNLDIPHAVASGEVDVMITDTVEAIHYEALDKRLAAPRIQEKWIPAEKSYLVRESEGTSLMSSICGCNRTKVKKRWSN